MAKLSNFKGADKSFKTNKINMQDDLEKQVEHYKTMNENELRGELFKQVAKQKSEGKFDMNALREMVESVRGVVGEESYQNICSLLGEIDD